MSDADGFVVTGLLLFVFGLVGLFGTGMYHLFVEYGPVVGFGSMLTIGVALLGIALYLES